MFVAVEADCARCTQQISHAAVLCIHRKEADVARQQLADSSALEADLEGSLRELRARCGALRAESTSQQNAGAVVRALLEAKKSGQIPGVYGRLGDLGAIDAK